MTCYSEQTVEFLWALRLNNSREWFQAHKEDYERLMLRPTKDLANALFDHLRDKYPKHDWTSTSPGSTGTRGGSSAGDP